MVEAYKEICINYMNAIFQLPDWVFYALFGISAFLIGGFVIWWTIRIGKALVKK